MATFTVTTSADDGVGSLRAAVSAANASAGADVVGFDAAVFDGGSEDLIRLTSGQIEITDGLTITGGPSGVTITGDASGDDVTLAGGITDVGASLEGEDRLDDNSRIFAANAVLTLDGLTLTGGRTITDFEDGGGGAVRGTTVTLIDSTVSGNSTAGDNAGGGGVSGFGDVTLTNSTVSGNSTAGDYSRGGGVRGYGDVTLTNSTVSGNSTAGRRSYGGGVESGYHGDYGRIGGDVTLTNSTVSGNSTAGRSSEGGGIWGYDVTLTNSTVSGNSTAGDNSDGGGIWGDIVTLTNSTVSGNSTAGDNSDGGGIRGGSDGYYGRYGGVTLTNSIVLGNATIFAGVDGDEVEGELTRTGGNILGGDLFDSDADVGDVAAEEAFAATAEIAPGVLAGALADNGGPTRTILIAADGPAVDAGGVATLPIDQRGLERVVGEAVDLGAVELSAGPAEPGSLVVTTALDVVENDGLTSLREAAFFANLEPGTDTIIFDASVFDGEACDVLRLTSGQIEITEALILKGGSSGVTITGDATGDDVTLAGGITDVAASGAARLEDNSRIFNTTAALTLDGLTLTGGRTTADNESGGAVRGRAVTLTNSVVSGNSTAGDNSSGGGVYGTGVVMLTNSLVRGNSTEGDEAEGGGVKGHNVTLTNSTISGNSTAGDYSSGGGVDGVSVTLTNSMLSSNTTAGHDSNGGGLFGGYVTLIDSTLSGNSTAGFGSAGGGVWGGLTGEYGAVYGNVTLTNSTVSGNSTTGDGSNGGGIFGLGVELTNSTVSGNSTAGDGSNGGGVYSEYGLGVTLTNSIVLGNAAISAGAYGDEVAGAVGRGGGNILGGDLFDGDTDVGDVTAAEVFAETTEIAPGVFAGVLADNGGPTQTIAIQADGPAAGAADPATALAADQRGFARDDAPDLGAFEAGAVGGLQLFGGPEADVLVGEAGDDRLWGRGGNDVLRGRAGDDLLRGGTGDDLISGGRGGDRVSGGMGDDMLYGGKGRDVFVFRPDPGADTIVAFDANARGGQDKMDLTALGISAASFASAVTLEQTGDDTRITLEGQGSILCTGIDGADVAVIDQSDFLLLA